MDRKGIRTRLFTTLVEDKHSKTNTITTTYVNKIANTTYSYPVISLYLDLSGEKTLRDPKQFLSYFNSFKTEALKGESSYLKSLNREQQKTLKKDLDAIEAIVKNQLVIEGFQSIIIFKSSNQLDTVIKLPLHIKDYFTIEPSPYTSPLDGLLQEQRKTLIVKLDRNTSHFYLCQLGHCEAIKKINSEIPEEDIDKSRPEKVQVHQVEQLNRHFSKTNDYINKHLFQQTYDFMVVIGHEKTTTKKFINSLHPAARLRLLETSTLSPIDIENDEKMYSVIDAALQKHEEHREALAIQELQKIKGQGGLIEGLEQVIKTLNRGLLKKLYLSNTYAEKGFVCPDRHYLSIDKTKCNLCEKVLIPVRNCIDELIEIASKQNVETILFTRKPESLQPFQNIAALIYITT